MAGIDHSQAELKIREKFSFTRLQIIHGLNTIKENFHVTGSVIVSTCNRTEFWISCTDQNPDMYSIINQVRTISKEEYDTFFIKRQGEVAISHLLKTTCGLESKIVGEDQILSQVKDALALSRKEKSDDMVLEKLFQTAITAAKKIKAQIKLGGINPSAATSSMELLKKQIGDLTNVPCLIIGNGQIGKLIAGHLVGEGADVSMTLRKKFHQNEEQTSVVPFGCKMINYEKRLENIHKYKVVISATLSPHFTIHENDISPAMAFDNAIWLDLAVPRDIDPKIENIQEIDLYNMDNISNSFSYRENQIPLEKAKNILVEFEEELLRWFAFRPYISEIDKITDLVVEDLCKRLEKTIGDFDSTKEEQKNLKKQIQISGEKSVKKLFFGLRDNLPSDYWQVCLSSLEASAKKDTLKTGSIKE